MLLALDIGNTSINLGVFRENELICRAKLSSEQSKTADEYAVLISGILKMKGVELPEIDGARLLSAAHAHDNFGSSRI